MKQLLAKLKLYGPKKFLYFAFRESFNLFNRFFYGSYSQEGEDLLIYRLLNKKKHGFYVDVGAYDPNRFSNTKFFYNKGWSGINIEPDPDNYKKFLKARSRDINLNIGVGAKNGKMSFYQIFPDTLSTFSKKQAQFYEKIGFKIIGRKKFQIKRLDSVIRKYCKDKTIDFLSIDTEDYETEVLKSNNWKLFRPKIICIESYTFNTEKNPGKERVEIKDSLLKCGYKRIYANETNIIYADNTR